MPLTDSFQRKIQYLRVSVQDQCDLRCLYCIPKGFRGFKEPENWLSFNEISTLTDLFGEAGVKHIRLTGGEPLLRRNLPELVAKLKDSSHIEEISLSTNGLRLPELALPLKEAGLNRINISLDSLQAERYRQITHGKLNKALSGIESAQAAGFEQIKINMVVMQGFNADETIPMLEFCLQRNLTLRFIETMPMGDTGRLASKHYLSLQAVRDRIDNYFELIPTLPDSQARHRGPAKYYQIAGTDAKVGFITPISQHFCDHCNRVRLGVDGMLYLCLGQDDSIPLGTHLRNGASPDELREAIAEAMRLKPKRHEFKEKPESVVRFMSVTGG